MNELESLRVRLHAILGGTMDLPGIPTQLPKEIERLGKWLKESGSGRPPRDRMREAVLLFRETRRLATLQEARLVCFGSIETFEGLRQPLIEDEKWFLHLLAEVDDFHAQPRAFRRCFRGLLHAYLRYDPERTPADSGGRPSHRRLRRYLNERIGSIEVEGSQPAWVDVITEHQNLLTEDPVGRYGAAMLHGDSSEFDGVRAGLEVDADSWVLRRLVLAQVKAATEQVDEQFRPLVDRLLKTLDEYPLQRDEGLGLLVDRYAVMHDRPEHARLRDASVSAWGTPWMTANDVRWQRVTPESRSMVKSWLNLKLIKQFFDVLAEDRNTDQRRVRFWQRYHAQIEEIYFALGPNAAGSHDADIRQLRKEMGSHLLWLRGGGAANNAFIMRMGGYVVVEFGLKGNACYIFRANDLPFRLSGEVAGDRTQLKHDTRHEERLLHIDRSYETWEQDFESTLRKLGVHPSPGGGDRGPDRPIRPTGDGPTTSRDTVVPPEPYSWTALSRWATAHGFQIEDLVRRGGSLWVVGPKEHGPHTNRLVGWGFRWAERRQAWYRSE